MATSSPCDRLQAVFPRFCRKCEVRGGLPSCDGIASYKPQPPKSTNRHCATDWGGRSCFCVPSYHVVRYEPICGCWLYGRLSCSSNGMFFLNCLVQTRSFVWPQGLFERREFSRGNRQNPRSISEGFREETTCATDTPGEVSKERCPSATETVR